MSSSNHPPANRCAGGIDCICDHYRQGNMEVKWIHRAACKGLPTKMFFPERNEYEAGKQICAKCEVREQCLENELQFDMSNHGLFGGLTPAERWDLKLRRWNAI